MTIKKGSQIFVRSNQFYHAELIGFVMAAYGNDLADVVVIAPGHNPFEIKSMKRRGDGDEYGFLGIDDTEPKSPADIKQEQHDQLVAEANSKLASGELTTPPETEEPVMENDEFAKTSLGDLDEEEETDESETDEEASEDGQESDPADPVDKPAARSSSRRKR
jgi:hypothetical protein